MKFRETLPALDSKDLKLIFLFILYFCFIKKKLNTFLATRSVHKSSLRIFSNASEISLLKLERRIQNARDEAR